MPGVVMRLAAAAAVIGVCAAQNGTKTPPELDFPMVNGKKKPKFRIFPGGEKTKNATWIGIEFGKIQELRAAGGGGGGAGGGPPSGGGPGANVVQSHAITKLADEEIVFSNATITLYGVSAQMIEMNLTSLSFNESDCPNPADTRPMVGISAGSVNLQVIIFNDDADVPYDNYTVPIKKGQMKFNIKANDWPFCMRNNSLQFTLILMMPGDEKPPPAGKQAGSKDERKPREMKEKPKPMTAKEQEDALKKTGKNMTAADKSKAEADYAKELRRPPSKKFSGDGGGNKDVNMDLPELVLLDGHARMANVETAEEGSRTVIKFTFPFFNNTLVYDPVVEFDEPEAATTDTVVTTTAQSALVSGGGRPSAWGTMVLFLVGFMLPRRAQ